MATGSSMAAQVGLSYDTIFFSPSKSTRRQQCQCGRARPATPPGGVRRCWYRTIGRSAIQGVLCRCPVCPPSSLSPSVRDKRELCCLATLNGGGRQLDPSGIKTYKCILCPPCSLHDPYDIFTMPKIENHEKLGYAIQPSKNRVTEKFPH